MRSYTDCASALKTFMAAGAMLLATLGASAQQEVAPDHFDGTPAVAAQKARPAKKQMASHKTARNAKRNSANQPVVVAKNTPAAVVGGR